MVREVVLLAVAGMVCPVSADAHHSPASHYLLDRSITVEGVVTEFRLINPHARIYFDVTLEPGKVQHWMAEGNAASILSRHGWTRDTLSPGDVITVTGNPARDGGLKVDWKVIVLPDGTKMHGGNTVGMEHERQLESLEQRRRQTQSDPHD
jgi:hypothetical protein